MRLAFAVLGCLLLAGCQDVDTGNSLDERLIARIDIDSLSADGAAEVRSSWPGEELPEGEYVFRLSLPGADSTLRPISAVTVERVVYDP